MVIVVFSDKEEKEGNVIISVTDSHYLLPFRFVNIFGRLDLLKWLAGLAKAELMYRRNGALRDVILNDVRRDDRFQQIPANIQELYQDAGQLNVARRRVRNFIGRKQRG